MSFAPFNKTLSAAVTMLLASTVFAACGGAPENGESNAREAPQQASKAPEPAPSGAYLELLQQCSSAQLQKCRANDPDGWPGCYVQNGKAICIYN